METFYAAGRQLRIEKSLGAGGFGVVSCVRDEATAKLLALKDIVCQNASAVNGALQEIRVLNSLAHPNIIQLMAADSYTDMQGIHVRILMEYCSGGNLNDRLARPSNDSVNLKWMRQIADALAYLHSRNPPVVHRDLKPENVLLTDPVNEDVKLADFGLARKFISLKQATGPTINDAQYYMQTGAGTLLYMAPEVFTRHYTEKADIFSMGILFYAIVERGRIQLPNGKIAYGAFVSTPNGMLGLGYAMANGYPNSTVAFTRAARNIQQLICNLLSSDYHERMNASDVRV